jgi:hypothetical protein
MTILVLVLVALGGGAASILVAPTRSGIGAAIGLGTALAAVIIALVLPTDDGIATGGASLTSSGLVRLTALGWSIGALGVGLLELAGRRRVVTGPALVGLGTAIVAVAVHDPATGFAALGGGGLAAILVPGLAGWRGHGGDPAHLPTVSRGSWAVIGSALLGIAVIAWAASPVGPLANGPPTGDPETRAATSLAVLGVVAAVALRSGLIPAHVWAARFTEGVSPLAIPAALIWGPAAFMLVALDWGQVAIGPTTLDPIVRALIVGAGVASILIGGLAALLHDDLEHILGYSILQDAGIAILAFASLHTEAADAARDWLLASAMLKTALAAWVSAMRSTFGAHRLVDLRGWVSRAPGLAVAIGLIWLGAVGLPGMALFAARAALIGFAVSGWPGTILLVLAVLAPALVLGRVLAIGSGAPSAAVAAAPSWRPRWRGGREAGWSGRPLRALASALPVEIRANRTPLIALLAIILAVLAFGVAIVGVTV